MADEKVKNMNWWVCKAQTLIVSIAAKLGCGEFYSAHNSKNKLLRNCNLIARRYPLGWHTGVFQPRYPKAQPPKLALVGAVIC
jgi:hypothetical protein